MEALGETGEKDESLSSLFTGATGKKEEDIKFASLGEDAAPAVITVSEESRRMQEMMRMYGMGNGGVKNDEILTVNLDSASVKRLAELDDTKRILAAKHIYMSALLLSRRLTNEETEEFVKLNSELLAAL